MTVGNGDILRIVCSFLWGEDEFQNVYHMQIQAGSEQDEDDVLADITAFFNDAYDNIDTLLPDEISFDRIEVWNVSDDSYVGIDTWPTLTVGGSGGDPLPPQLANLLLFNTGYPGSQGKKFLPPTVEGSIDTDGTVTAATLVSLGLIVVDLLAGMTGVSVNGTLGNWNSTLARFAEWLTGVPRDIFATQRRRYFGRGT